TLCRSFGADFCWELRLQDTNGASPQPHEACLWPLLQCKNLTHLHQIFDFKISSVTDSSRRVRTRTHGGVRGRRVTAAPMPIKRALRNVDEGQGVSRRASWRSTAAKNAGASRSPYGDKTEGISTMQRIFGSAGAADKLWSGLLA